MKKLLNPHTLFFISTLPLILLMSLFYAQYNIIASLLDEETIMLWERFAYFTTILLLIHSITIGYFIKKKQKLNNVYAVAALIVYISLAYWYSAHTDDFITSQIPRWMVSTELIVYVGSFLMPTIIHAIIILVLNLTKKIETTSPILNFGFAVIVPFLWYIASQIAIPLYKIVDDNFNEHVLFIIIIASVISFLFFLFRGIYILAITRADKWSKYDLVWKIPVALLFPILGLLLNNGIISDIVSASGKGVFGNFNHPWFYIIAIVNGIILCLPQYPNHKIRLLLFTLKTITYSYTVYFFIIFVPFLPFSVVAVIALGLGFLMLAPLLLFVFQTTQIHTDFQFLRQFYSKSSLISLQIFGFCLIPICITANFMHDKMILNETLEYVYAPNLNKSYDIDKKSLANTLNKIIIQKDSKNHVLFGSQTPYISMFFNWMVLDNLTLSDEKINTLEAVFYGKNQSDSTPSNSENSNVKIANYSISTRYDNKEHCYKSWIHFNLKNQSNNGFQGYTTSFNLPEHCFISDYYLYVGKQKKKGLLTEKKSALWVFNQIQNENKDPGIIYYKNDKTIGFKVFPFTAYENRKTGFEIIHKESVELTFDGKTIAIPAGTNEPKITPIETKNAIYMPSSEKSKLQKIVRQPLYNFIIDASELAKGSQDKQIQIIEDYIAQKNIKKSDIQFTVSNSTVKEIVSLKVLKNSNYEGGFYLERALQNSLIQNYKTQNPRQLIPVIVSENINQSILTYDFNNLEFTFPEQPYFYNLRKNGTLNTHLLTANTKEAFAINQDIKTNIPVYCYNLKNRKVYLPTTLASAIILKNANGIQKDNQTNLELFKKGIETKALMYTMVLNPEQKEKLWFDLLKLSFTSKLLNPITAYMVVENEAQEKMLIKKQNEIINGNKNLDLEETEVQRMSEPETVLALILFLSYYLFTQTKRKIKN